MTENQRLAILRKFSNAIILKEGEEIKKGDVYISEHGLAEFCRSSIGYHFKRHNRGFSESNYIVVRPGKKVREYVHGM